MVKVVLSSVFSTLTGGKREVEVEAEVIKDVLKKLTEIFGENLKERFFDSTGRLKWFITIYLNGTDIRLLEGTNTKVKRSDEILILHSVSGG
ncbi:MAG: MoaD/ThiS family protein [Candidatus Methanomethyliaceae archaeon]